MKRLIQLLILSLVTIIGSNAATTVAQRLLRADGQPYTGRFRISWPTYLNASGAIVRAGYTTVVLESDGDFSVSLAPHIASPASGPIYTVDYNELRQGTRQTEYWDVPDTVSTLAIAAVVTTQPSAAPIGITSLPNLVTVGTITTGVWHGTPITVPYGGTGGTTFTGVLKGNGTSPFSVVTGTATDCVLVDGTSGPCGSGGAVSSVFGRTGTVIAVSGDYAGTLVTNTPAGNIAATTVQAALNELDSEKQATGNYVTALTGDVTASGPGSAAATLATVNSNTGACGDATHVCRVTLNAKGLATAASAVAITAGTGDVVGPAAATDNCAPVYDGTTGKLIKDSGLCYDTTKNGSDYLQGVTSGGLGLSVANIAGTAVTLIWPTDSNAAADGAALTMGAAATCPTLLPSGMPSTCRYMTWTTPTGTGGGGLSGSSAIDFSSMADGACIDNTFTLTGLTAGQAISVGLPSSLSSGILSTGIASATNTAKIRLCNWSGAAVDLASLTYSVTAPTAISGSGTINFGNIPDGTCATASTFTLTGAAAGTRISIGPPAGLEAGLILRMVVTAADTVSVQPCNFSGTDLNPASGTFSAAIL